MTDALSVGLGDVVQITDEKHPWYGCLLIVSEVKGWGVQAYCLIPKSNAPDGEAPSEAYNRLAWEDITVVGPAKVLR